MVSEVAVVIPAYNAERTIATSIASAQQQEPAPTAVVVVDDGSLDGTSSIASSMGAVVLKQANAGPAAARNRGAASTEAPQLVFLDADDRLEPGFLAACSAGLAVEPRATAVIPNKLVSAPRPTPLWPVGSPERSVIERQQLGGLLRTHWLHPTGLVSRSSWSRHPFDEDPGLIGCEDTCFWIDLLLAGESLVVLKDPYVSEQVGRDAPLTRNIQRMRLCRYHLYVRLWRDHRLTRRERLLVGTKLLKLITWRTGVLGGSRR